LTVLSFVVFNPPGCSQPCLVPSTAFDQVPFRRLGLKHGDVLTSEFVKRRSGKHHRLVFGMLKLVFDSQERFEHVEALRRHLTLETSFVIECMDKATGEVIRMARSWAYSEMDEAEFSQLHEELVPVILREFYPTEDVNWLKNAVTYQAFMDGVLAFI
jgi:hypothetical protein